MSQMRNRQKKEYGKYIHLNEKIWDICDEMATPKQREAFDPNRNSPAVWHGQRTFSGQNHMSLCQKGVRRSGCETFRH